MADLLGKALEPFVFYRGCYLLALDGTGYFSSQKIHCDSCLEKVNKKTGEVIWKGASANADNRPQSKSDAAPHYGLSGSRDES